MMPLLPDTWAWEAESIQEAHEDSLELRVALYTCGSATLSEEDHLAFYLEDSNDCS
jgi:hypothetical protein